MSTRIENGIRRLRETAGLTQQELAAELGIDKSTLSKWESGSPVPDIFKVRVARRFSMPVHHVFYFDTAVEVGGS